MPLRLSWRISQIKNATNGNRKTRKKIREGKLNEILFNELAD